PPTLASWPALATGRLLADLPAGHVDGVGHELAGQGLEHAGRHVGAGPILRLADIYRGHVVDVTDKSYTVEVTGTTDKLDSFLETVGKLLILETVRTGAAGIGRGERILKI
ncbi:MAG: hypothetical protein ACFNKE_09525, partial [Neisseria elongata]